MPTEEQKMNGEHGKIYTLVGDIKDTLKKDMITINEKLIKLEVTSNLHHHENRKDLDILFEGQRRVDNLPCKTHKEKMFWIITIGMFIVGWLGTITFLHVSQ